MTTTLGTRLFGALGVAILALALAVPAASAAPVERGFAAGTYVQVRTSAGRLNVRSGPRLGAPVLGRLRSGARVRVLAGPRSASGHTWYRVTGGGLTGWSAGRYLYRNGENGEGGSGGGSSAGRRYSVVATGYNGAEFGSRGIMACGKRVYWGAVAVDPRVFRLGTRMKIEGFGNKVFLACDTGSAIKGYRIDIWFPSVRAALDWGVRRRTITILP